MVVQRCHLVVLCVTNGVQLHYDSYGHGKVSTYYRGATWLYYVSLMVFSFTMTAMAMER